MKRFYSSVLFTVVLLALGPTSYFLRTRLALAGESHSAHAKVGTTVALDGPDH